MPTRLFHVMERRFPWIRKSLIVAHIRDTPVAFLNKSFKAAMMLTVILGILTFFFLDKVVFDKAPLKSIGISIVLMMIYLFFLFVIFIQSPKVEIRKRERDINKEVLFAGRYLLVKLDSGVPLYNALIDASKSYGISAKYFKEIVDDIRVGTPIEQALETSRELSPSKYFKLILTELITSLKTGVDVSIALREVLQHITKEQILEIKTYSKKLNAFMMMYMVLATVLPSLGVTMFIIIAGFMRLQMTGEMTFVFLFLLSLIQLMFLSVLKSMRPMVNL